MKAGYRYRRVRCDRCGAMIFEQWLIRHRKSGCRLATSEPQSRKLPEIGRK